ncbi:hypothetical protein LOS22_14495 [Enterococcus faecium]|nr:hypothetical protein [Enterococcus faecium]
MMSNLIEQVKGNINSGEEGQKFAFSSMMRQNFGVNLTADKVDAIWEAYNKDSLSQENIDKIINENESTGKDKYKKNADDYANSKEGMANRSEAVTEKQASGVNDYGDALRELILN